MFSLLFPPAAAQAAQLTLQLPDHAVPLPLIARAGSLRLTAISLARALAATVETRRGGAMALRWEGRRALFTANRREVETSTGTAMLSTPTLRLGSVLWLPADGAAIAARERFGAHRVRWDPDRWTLTVAPPAQEIRAVRVGSHPDRVRVVFEASAAVDWAVLVEGDGRLVVSLPGSTLSPTLVRREYSGGLLRAVEPVQGPGGTQVRVAFGGRTEQVRWFALHDPFRIVVDLYRDVPLAARPGAAGREGGPAAATPATASAAGGYGGGTGAGTAGVAVPGPAPAVGPGGQGAGALGPAAPVGSPSASAHPAAIPPMPAGEAPGGGAQIVPTEAARAMAGAPSGTSASGPAELPPDGVPRNNADPPAAPPGISPKAGRPLPANGLAPTVPSPPEPPRQGSGVPLTIVIDPGHGGKDTGAIGPHGLKEKDVVLDIGLRLQRLLSGRLGARVIMTRSDDTFVPLEERAAIANRARADFFISIHVNAAAQARATGVETYYLSREPSDHNASASAARENLVLNLEGVSPREQDSLKAVLWDMAESLHMQESSAMAEMLLEGLGRALRVETRGVKHGPFVVLMTAGMPSALVEVAFISNPNQERRLQEEGYRHSIAVALSGGVERFAHRFQRRLGMQPSRPGPS